MEQRDKNYNFDLHECVHLLDKRLGSIIMYNRKQKKFTIKLDNDRTTIKTVEELSVYKPSYNLDNYDQVYVNWPTYQRKNTIFCKGYIVNGNKDTLTCDIYFPYPDDQKTYRLFTQDLYDLNYQKWAKKNQITQTAIPNNYCVQRRYNVGIGPKYQINYIPYYCKYDSKVSHPSERYSTRKKQRIEPQRITNDDILADIAISTAKLLTATAYNDNIFGENINSKYLRDMD